MFFFHDDNSEIYQCLRNAHVVAAFFLNAFSKHQTEDMCIYPS